MENLQAFIAKLIIKITWVLTVLLPIEKNKITYISYYSNEIKGDFKLISNKLRKKGSYKQVFLLLKFSNTLKDKFLYLINFVQQTYHLNTSKVIIIDANNFVISNCKKKQEVKVIQLWHASGAIKKFGYDQDRRYEIKNYDYIFTAGKESVETFSSAFRMDKAKILPLGVAKTDILYKKKTLDRYKREMEQEYPQIKNKKVILYAPTFRGDGVLETKPIDVNLKEIQKALGESYVILYKLHPSLINESLDSSEKVINVNDKSIYRAFAAADILISDYSAVIFDFSILEKPMVFYVPDLEEYKKDRGFYYDYESFIPGPICFNEKQVVEAIVNNIFDMDKIRKIKEKFFDHRDGKSTQRIVDHIEKILKDKLL
jgi:CDP-ribitol ribitolphosphotransferase